MYYVKIISIRDLNYVDASNNKTYFFRKYVIGLFIKFIFDAHSLSCKKTIKSIFEDG